MSTTHTELTKIGRQLHDAATRDLAAAKRRRLRSTLIFGAATICVLVAVGGGIAAGIIKTSGEEELGLLNGAATFRGTNPVCTQLSATHFSCALTTAPTELTFGPGGNYLDVKMESVDATKHVDGGCVATSADGREWDCYLGQEAVRRGIISPGFLGQFLPTPPHG